MTAALLRLAEVLSLIVGTGGLAVFLGAQLDAWQFANRQGARLEARLREWLATPYSRSPFPGSRARLDAAGGAVWARIEFPRQRASELVAEGLDETTLRRVVGHFPNTAFPGEPGNVALAGHRDSHFRVLRELRRGDRVRLVSGDGVFEYEVESLAVVEPEATSVLDAGDEPSLTLVTCYPFDYVGPAPQRFVVRARQLEPGALD